MEALSDSGEVSGPMGETGTSVFLEPQQEAKRKTHFQNGTDHILLEVL